MGVGGGGACKYSLQCGLAAINFGGEAGVLEGKSPPPPQKPVCVLLTFGACARVTVITLSVCLCFCYQSSAIVRRLRDTLNLPDRSSLNSDGFQLADVAKTLSLPRYSSFFALARRWRPF